MRTSSLKITTFFAILFSQALGAPARDAKEPESRWFIEDTTESNSDSNIDVDTNIFPTRSPSPQDLSKIIGIILPTRPSEEPRDMDRRSSQVDIGSLLGSSSSSGDINELSPEKRDPQLGGLTGLLGILGLGASPPPEKRDPQLSALTSLLGILNLGGAPPPEKRDTQLSLSELADILVNLPIIGPSPSPSHSDHGHRSIDDEEFVSREPQLGLASLLQSLGGLGGGLSSSGDHPPPERRDTIMESIRRDPQLLSILGPLLGTPSEEEENRRDIHAGRTPQLDISLGLGGLLGTLPGSQPPQPVAKEP